MNTKTIVAAVLIAVGVVIMAYSGISFTTPGETVSFLGLRVETTNTHFIPPVVGAFVLITLKGYAGTRAMPEVTS